MKASECKALLAFLVACYPRAEVRQETLDAYSVMLADLPAEETRQAVQRLVAASQWFPSIAEIRAAVIEKRTGLPPAELAWGEVMDRVVRLGRGARPEFSAPEIDRAVRIIGWSNICNSDTIGVERAHFFRIYDGIAKQSRNDVNYGSLLRAAPTPMALPKKGES